MVIRVMQEHVPLTLLWRENTTKYVLDELTDRIAMSDLRVNAARVRSRCSMAGRRITFFQKKNNVSIFMRIPSCFFHFFPRPRTL